MSTTTTDGKSLTRVGVLHPIRLVGEAVARAIDDHSPFQAEVLSPPYSKAAPDIIVVVGGHSRDVLLPDIREAKRTFPGARVVVIGGPDAPADMVAYIENGASGATPLDGSMDECIQILRKVGEDKASCPPEVLDLLFQRVTELADRLKEVETSDLAKLTRREIEILELVSKGLSNKEIASLLSIQLATVKNHIHNLLDKLGVRDRREARSLAMALHSSEDR